MRWAKRAAAHPDDTMSLADLHAPYAELLRESLAGLSPAGARLALDLGCGPGLKLGWLARQLAPGGAIIAVDLDRGALRAALGRAADARGLPDPGGGERPLIGAAPLRVLPVAGDAQRLPLRAGACDLCWCVATLGLLSDPAGALAEIRRALRPGGALVVTLATERWVRPRRWPAALIAAGRRLPATARPAPADDLGDDLRAQLAAAGLRTAALLAALLDGPEPAAQPAWLALAGWDTLRPLVADALDAAARAACAAAEESAEPEIRPVLLVAQALAEVSQ